MKGWIFDLDGTLIDSCKDHVNCDIATLREFGIALTRDIAKEYSGLTVRDYFVELSERFGVSIDIDAALERHEAVLAEYYSERFPVVPHAVEVLRELSSGGDAKLALATNARRSFAEAALERMGVSDLFDFVCGFDDVERGKPDPEMHLLCAREMGISPADCVVVEDSETGFAAAKAAGMKLIARKAGHNEFCDFSSADLVVEDLSDIVNFSHE